MRHITDTDALSGADKAAIMFLCLGEARGTAMVAKLSDPEIHDVMSAMASLGVVERDVVHEVLEEFRTGVGAGGTVHGSVEHAERLLSGIFPQDKVSDFLNGFRGPVAGSNLWEDFSGLNEKAIVTFLEGEHDQTAAVMLSRMRPDVVAKILPQLGETRSVDVAERMITMDAVPRPVLEAIEQTIAAEFLTPAAARTGADMPQRMADIFNKMDPTAFEGMEGALSARSPESFGEIKQKMFTFDDLARLQPMDLAKVIAGAPDPGQVPVALIGANKAVREAFLDAVPSRARGLLEDEIANLKQVRAKDAIAAQNEMVDRALEMVRTDEIRMPVDEDELL